MIDKLKLKQLSLAITISGSFVLFWLIFNKGILSLLEKPLSAIGNIPTNYLMFFIGSGIVFYFVMLFFIKIYISEKIKVRWELYILPVLIFLTLIIPYREDFFIARVLHTAAGVLGALLIVFIMYKINKFYFPQNPIVKKITRNIPAVTVAGTLTLFFLTGLSTIMQLFYLFLSLIWINLYAFSKKTKKK